jgi:hypothetical protein
VLTLLAGLRGRLSLTTDALTFLVAVIAVALGVTWYGLRRLGREIRHGYVG